MVAASKPLIDVESALEVLSHANPDNTPEETSVELMLELLNRKIEDNELKSGEIVEFVVKTPNGQGQHLGDYITSYYDLMKCDDDGNDNLVGLGEPDITETVTTSDTGEVTTELKVEMLYS
jgi:hypothetical protein